MSNKSYIKIEIESKLIVICCPPQIREPLLNKNNRAKKGASKLFM